MRHSQFYIGRRFLSGGQLWMCTDWGRRTIIAVSLEPFVPAGNYDRELKINPEEDGWLDGPPYALEEIVFDEDDLPACEPIDEPNKEFFAKLYERLEWIFR